MVAACCVHNCTERHNKNESVSFHCFPTDARLKRLWTKALKRKRNDFVPSQHARVCSRHFTPDSYDTNAWSSRRALKKDAIPTIFDSAPKITKTKNSNDNKKIVKKVINWQPKILRRLVNMSTSNANPPVEFVAVEDFAANINGKEVGASPKRNTANASMVVGQPSSSQMNRGIKRKVVTTTTKQTVNTSNEDEFDLFCKSLACQLRNMPLNRALICQEKLQSIMTQERLSQMGINYEQQAEPTEYEVIVKQETDVDAKSEY